MKDVEMKVRELVTFENGTPFAQISIGEPKAAVNELLPQRLESVGDVTVKRLLQFDQYGRLTRITVEAANRESDLGDTFSNLVAMVRDARGEPDSVTERATTWIESEEPKVEIVLSRLQMEGGEWVYLRRSIPKNTTLGPPSWAVLPPDADVLLEWSKLASDTPFGLGLEPTFDLGSEPGWEEQTISGRYGSSTSFRHEVTLTKTPEGRASRSVKIRDGKVERVGFTTIAEDADLVGEVAASVIRVLSSTFGEPRTDDEFLVFESGTRRAELHVGTKLSSVQIESIVGGATPGSPGTEKLGKVQVSISAR